jgi:Peptidase inhibitor I78 family
MWKPLLAALAIGSLAGCIAISVNENANLPSGGQGTCDASSYQYLIGQSEDAIERERLPKTFRVICAECMVTQDLNPNRLNIHLGTDKKVGSVRCG